ncbi:MAG: PqqD family protein [Sphingopyxis sp.]|nr:PqqD family protein [Sphingopyxis sp.]
MEKYSAADDVVACELDGSFALLNLETSEYFKLNEPGAVIWKRMADGATLAELVSAISKEFDVSDDECREDVTNLVVSLEKAKLVARAN